MPITQPVDIINRALDECGVDAIDDLGDGSPTARAALRIYDPTLRQLLSAVHWNFARKQNTLTIIGDATGIYYSDNRNVPQPWCYMYEWPTDCVFARWVPYTIANNTVDGTLGSPGVFACGRPSPFLVGSAPIPNPPDSDWGAIEGHDPEQTRVILSNQLNASLIYTGLMQYPDAWDPLFEQAMAAVIAARLAMPLIEDKKFARVVRADNVALATQALNAARVRDGDEGWTTQNYEPDWIRARTSGYGYAGPGVWYYPYVAMDFESFTYA